MPGSRLRSAAAAAFLAAAVAVPLAPAVPAAPASASPAAETCDPVRTEPRHRGDVPSPREELGFGLGERAVTVEESDRYLEAVAEASPRVVSGTLATSWEGRPLRYAIVGRPGNVTERGLARVREAAAKLRDPHTPEAEARRVVERSPQILWVAGNIHGDEESGADAALRTLYHLADRADCAAERILGNAVVVVLPIQNPDGRAADSRRNAYGFDMNRDWFARTQPETDGKLEMLRDYPPTVFVDAHEMGGRGNYFFPPNPDPIHHEITGQSLKWIDAYGAAMAGEFDRQGIDYFTQDVYDLFYMGYGDTVPTTGFLAAGMTFEKNAGDPIGVRAREQYLTQWVTLSTAAAHREEILADWREAHVEAYRQGLAGELEPNEVRQPGNEVVRPVPDRKVRHYFLRADDPAKARQVQRIVRRLQRMDIEVRRLTEPVSVPDFRAYGRAPEHTTLPVGTYWVPMAQAGKHWIQAMLGEDSHTPFPYFYDVTAWSLPLLGNVAGGSSGARLTPAAETVPPLPKPQAPDLPADLPAVGVLQLGRDARSAVESTGWLRYRLDQEWGVGHRVLHPSDIASGGLEGIDVLLVPHGPAAQAHKALGENGREALRSWVDEGGRYVGWRGGAVLAARLGVTTAVLEQPTSDVPGSLLRVDVDARSPLARGVGGHAWQFYAYDVVMRASDPSHVVASYPEPGSAGWFVSGFERGAEELGGTAALVSEPVGKGSAVVFAGEPNFRAYTDGTARFVLNAVTGADPAPEDALPAGAAARADDERAARRNAAALPALDTPIRVSVRPGEAEEAAAVLRGLGARWAEQRSPGRVGFLVANPEALGVDRHPWARRLPAALREAGVDPLAVRLP